MKSFTPVLGLVTLCLATLSTSSQAATILSQPLNGQGQFQDPPELVFDQLRGGFAPNAGTDERDVRANRSNSQTFTLANPTTIDKIAINYQESALSGATATFQFFAVADPDAATLTPLAIIDSVTFTGADLTYASGTLVFDVVDTFAAAGTSYGIRFITGPTETAVFKWTFVPRAEVYADASRYENNSAQSLDMYTIGVIAVPEPTSLTLLGLVGAVAAIFRRQRRR